MKARSSLDCWGFFAPFFHSPVYFTSAPKAASSFQPHEKIKKLFWIFLITTFKIFKGDQAFTKKCSEVLSNVETLEKPMICFAEKVSLISSLWEANCLQFLPYVECKFGEYFSEPYITLPQVKVTDKRSWALKRFLIRYMPPCSLTIHRQCHRSMHTLAIKLNVLWLPSLSLFFFLLLFVFSHHLAFSLCD